jgi:hypothetical protein
MTRQEKTDKKSNKTLVMKFGGTSVGSLEAMHQVVKIVRETKQNWPRLVVVISALNGVTNLLLDSAKLASQGDVLTFHQAAQELRSRHYEIIQALVKDQADRSRVEQEVNHLIADFVNLCQAISVLGEATPRALDAVASLGERMSVRVLAAGLESSGVPSQFVEATQLIITDDYYTSAHPDMDLTVRRTRQVLLPILEQGRVPVVTGFIGQTSSGVITTLGRGGSDFVHQRVEISGGGVVGFRDDDFVPFFDGVGFECRGDIGGVAAPGCRSFTKYSGKCFSVSRAPIPRVIRVHTPYAGPDLLAQVCHRGFVCRSRRVCLPRACEQSRAVGSAVGRRPAAPYSTDGVPACSASEVRSRDVLPLCAGSCAPDHRRRFVGPLE